MPRHWLGGYTDLFSKASIGIHSNEVVFLQEIHTNRVCWFDYSLRARRSSSRDKESETLNGTIATPRRFTFIVSRYFGAIPPKALTNI